MTFKKRDIYAYSTWHSSGRFCTVTCMPNMT